MGSALIVLALLVAGAEGMGDGVGERKAGGDVNGVTPEIETMFDWLYEHQKFILSNIRESLRQARQQGTDFVAIKNAERQLRQESNLKGPPWNWLREPPEVNESGTLRHYKVFQIQDKQNAILKKIEFTLTDGDTGLVTLRTGTHFVWLRGYDTGGLTDDVEMPEIYVHVTGTTTYATRGGSANTVVVVEPFDHEAVSKLWPAWKKARDKQEKQAKQKSPRRPMATR